MNLLFRVLLVIAGLSCSVGTVARDMVPMIVPTALIPVGRVVNNVSDIPALAGSGLLSARTEIPVFAAPPSNLLRSRIVRTTWTPFMVDVLTGTVIPNATIVLGPLHQKPLSGGHDHDDPLRPTGALSSFGGNTGPTGLGLQIDYTSPEFGGVVFTQVNCNAPGYLSCGPDNFYSFTIQVQPRLVNLPPSMSYNLIGATATHQSNHWAKDSFLSKLQNVATQYFLKFGSGPSPKLAINDISLVDGGLFDVRGDWKTSHKEHRIGQTADLRTPPMAQAAWLRTALVANGIVGNLLIHVPPDPPHWHIREANLGE